MITVSKIRSQNVPVSMMIRRPRWTMAQQDIFKGERKFVSVGMKDEGELIFILQYDI